MTHHTARAASNGTFDTSNAFDAGEAHEGADPFGWYANARYAKSEGRWLVAGLAFTGAGMGLIMLVAMGIL